MVNMRRWIHPALPLLGLMMASCSGGDSSSAAPQPPAENTPPRVQILAQNEVAEGTTDVAFTFTSTDGDRDERTHTLSGPDAGFFELGTPRYDGTQAEIDLVIPTALDYEVPQDADGDGRYEITVEATDGTDSFSIDSEIVITDQGYQHYFPVQTLSGLDQPIQLVVADDDGLPDNGGFFITEKTGRIQFLPRYADSADDTTLVLDLSADVSSGNEQGLLGIALSPDFANDRTVYLNLTNTSGDTEIRRYQMYSGRADLLDPSTEEVLLRIDQPAGNHNAGWIGFSDDGLLLVPTGNGGGANDPDNRAQDPDDLLGKVLRLDITSDAFPADAERNYAIPASNPFSDGVDGAPEVFALGLRNPFKAAYEAATNTLIIADVGQGAREEVNRLSLDQPGTNFGWPLFEGTQPNKGSDATGLTPPLVEYSHIDGGRSITGGVVSRLDNAAADETYYFFADFLTGEIWYAELDTLADGSTITLDEADLDDPTVPVVVFMGSDGRDPIPGVTGFIYNLEGPPAFTTIDGDLFFLEPPTK